MTRAEAAVREYMAELAASGGGPFSGVKGPPTFRMPTAAPSWSPATAYAEPAAPASERMLRTVDQAKRYGPVEVRKRELPTPSHLAGQIGRYKK